MRIPIGSSRDSNFAVADKLANPEARASLISYTPRFAGVVASAIPGRCRNGSTQQTPAIAFPIARPSADRTYQNGWLRLVPQLHTMACGFISRAETCDKQ